MAPALTGAAFAANYDGQTVGDLFERNRTTMPPGKEGQMSAQDVADITAFMLKFNQFPAGRVGAAGADDGAQDDSVPRAETVERQWTLADRRP